MVKGDLSCLGEAPGLRQDFVHDLFAGIRDGKLFRHDPDGTGYARQRIPDLVGQGSGDLPQRGEPLGPIQPLTMIDLDLVPSSP